MSRLAKHDQAAPNRPDALGMYRDMMRIRRVEEAIAEHYPEQEMRCPVHLSIGQEATAVGVCAALGPDDLVMSTHRSHAHYLARGGDLKAMLAEIHGKAAGVCGGRGGSMHLFDDDVGFMLSMPIVASSIPTAVGMALAIKQQQRDAVAISFFGDAAVEEGVFHESANFAAVHALPVLFVCEDNRFSVYTPYRQRQPDRPIGRLAEAHGVACGQADGNDVAAVAAAAGEAVSRARSGGGPSFLSFETYRWREHCGPNFDDDLGYRDPAEVASWIERCPVEHARRRLRGADALSEADDRALIAEIDREIEAAFRFARAAPFPDPDTAAGNLYA